MRELAQDMNHWQGEIVVSPEALETARGQVSKRLKDDIAYAHDNIRRFAEAQRASCAEFEVTLRPGLTAGQKLNPVDSAGCYVPGGRYSHIASAIMKVTTAKAAGVGFVAAGTPPRKNGIPAEILYTLDLCGADRILALGDVQGIAALAFGLFGTRRADTLVGPETTVVFGDKAAGPNHVLPTSGVVNYTGGLSAFKFLKMVTWQKVTPDALRDLAQATASICPKEGMEGYARTADIRLKKHFPVKNSIWATRRALLSAP